jgi:hypothetical protein
MYLLRSVQTLQDQALKKPLEILFKPGSFRVATYLKPFVYARRLEIAILSG